MFSKFSILAPMKKLLLMIFAVTLSIAASADTDPRREYVDKYARIAVEEMKRTGVPASITLAQGLLESRYGQSELAVKGKNHFGIKCHNDWRGKKMYQDDDRRGECFRVYSNVEASFRDHSDFLRSRDRYKSLFDLDRRDYKGWAKGLKKAGYATDPLYADKLIDLIEDYELYRYDRNVKVPEKTPSELESPVIAVLPEARPEIDYSETVELAPVHTIYEQNGVPFLYAVEGETSDAIARANGLFAKELLRFNDLSAPCTFEGGEIVYLARKKTKGPKGVSKYVVESEGETLWSISQRFGVRMKSLLKMNPALSGLTLEEGDTVNLRK